MNEDFTQLNAFGYTTVKNVKRYTYEVALQSMKSAANRVTKYYDALQRASDDLTKQGFVDASIKAFEDYTEAFRDIMIMFCVDTDQDIPQTLAACIKNATKTLSVTISSQKLLELMYERNRLVHEYYNIEYNTWQFLQLIPGALDGLQELYAALLIVVKENQLLDKRIYKK